MAATFPPELPSMSNATLRHESRLAAFVLIATCVGGFVALLHHPTGAAVHAATDPGPMLALNGAVHAGMLAIVALLAVCLAQYTGDRGWHRLLPRSGFLLFAAGALAAGGAALVNGFIAPDLLRAGDDDAAVRAALWAANQRLMAVAGFALAAATGAWALDLLRSPGLRVFAWIGVALALAEVVWQIRIDSRFDVHAMQGFWLWLSAACVPFAVVMLRRPAD
jgi:hypothetical protein